MKKLTKLLKWLDNNSIKVLSTIFIFLIPLYPKLPLKMINYTYVAIRLEDLFIALLTAVFIIQLLRKKVKINRRFLIMFLAFWGAITLSYLYGVFIVQNLPYRQMSLLHTLRRFEYMVVFFVAAAAINTKKDFFYYLKLIVLALFCVTIYGIGQKFLGWPAIQTMNPEYAKGYLLVLDANARVSSTFGGHYDLAAYLVFLMPLVLGLYMSLKKKIYFFAFILSLSALVLTASRVSYGAYLISIIAFLILMRKPKLLFVVLVLTAVLTFLSGNLTKRLTRTFQQKKIFINSDTGQTTIPRNITPDDLPVGDFVPGRSVGQDIGAIPVDMANLNATDMAMIRKDLREQIVKDMLKIGKSLTKDQIDLMIDDYLKNTQVATAIIPDISFATRLQVEWPRAIKAFLKSPILGRGPGSITEATDNDYLRWLGEFGLLGTSIFIYILFIIIKSVYLTAKKTVTAEKYIFYGFLFGVFGLLINASYIDVFEASKVAYQFWFISGLFVYEKN